MEIHRFCNHDLVNTETVAVICRAKRKHRLSRITLALVSLSFLLSLQINCHIWMKKKKQTSHRMHGFKIFLFPWKMYKSFSFSCCSKFAACASQVASYFYATFSLFRSSWANLLAWDFFPFSSIWLFFHRSYICSTVAKSVVFNIAFDITWIYIVFVLSFAEFVCRRSL